MSPTIWVTISNWSPYLQPHLLIRERCLAVLHRVFKIALSFIYIFLWIYLLIDNDETITFVHVTKNNFFLFLKGTKAIITCYHCVQWLTHPIIIFVCLLNDNMPQELVPKDNEIYEIYDSWHSLIVRVWNVGFWWRHILIVILALHLSINKESKIWLQDAQSKCIRFCLQVTIKIISNFLNTRKRTGYSTE